MSVFNKIRSVISDYQESRAKREALRLEAIKKEWEDAKKAKIDYYTELSNFKILHRYNNCYLLSNV